MMKKIGLIMIICLFGISNDLYAQATCDDVDITISDATANNVLSGQTDNRHAEVTLTAANDVENGGTAHYKAGTSVTLGPGFHAKLGSEFTASIEACTVAEFITEWEINTTNPITIPTTGSGYNYTVDWGDGTVTSNHLGDASHAYQTYGTYQIKISGTFPRIYFKKTQLNKENQRIEKIIRWGQIQWTSMEGAFYKCFILTIDPNISDTPDLSNVTNMSEMFYEAKALNSTTLNDWNVSNVTNMSGMFETALDFNQSLSSWNVSSVTNMSRMFNGASDFTHSLETWNVSSVTDMSYMLDGTDLSPENYGNTLINWNNLTLQYGVTLHAKGLEYCSNATSARQNLIDTVNGHGWIITDDGVSGTCRSAGSNPRIAIEKPEDVFIYPNPVKNFLTLNGNINGLKEIRIVDMSGRTIGHFKDKSEVDVRFLKGGIYLLEITTTNRKEVIRFVKE